MAQAFEPEPRFMPPLGEFFFLIMQKFCSEQLDLFRFRCYGRRSQETVTVRDIFVPPHLYGQLALTKFGMDNLAKASELTFHLNAKRVQYYSLLLLGGLSLGASILG